MFNDFMIEVGATSGGLPSIVVTMGGNSSDILAGLLTSTTVNIIQWARDIIGYACIGGAVIKAITSIHKVISGDANLIGGESI